MTATCPNRESLRDYAVGRVADEVADSIADHLEGCPSCQAELATLDAAGDTLVERLQRPLAADPYEAESQCGQAMARAAAFAPFAAVAGRHEEDALDQESRHVERQNDLIAGRNAGLPIVLGEYELLEELGRGGMGRVFLARHTRLDRVVALKLLPKSRLGDPQAMARFEREMRAIGRLSHPRIVHAYDAREIDGQPALVMEFVDGFDLAELVRRVVPLRVLDACELARQAALALQCAHEHGLVHRDVKPSNLILSRAGEVKLLDLGLSRLCAETATGEELTGPELFMGTADYIAPEQARDSHAVDGRADIYSLGCTLYKLLTGRPPFSGPEYRGAFDKLTAHVSKPAPPVRNDAPEVPDELAAVLARMLAKRPEDRYATPGEVAAALEPFCVGADLKALAAEAAERSPSAATLDGVADSLETPPQIAPKLLLKPRRFRPWLWATAVGVVLLGSLAGLAAIVITIKKGDRETRLTVAEGSGVDIDSQGNATVRLPSAPSHEEARLGIIVEEVDAHREEAAFRLRQIGVALHLYHDQHKSFPPAVLHGPNGTPYSWRVAILPMLGRADLYDEYRRDQPWDSPHNVNVLHRIPDALAFPTAERGMVNTPAFALVGPGTAWDPASRQTGDAMGSMGMMGSSGDAAGMEMMMGSVPAASEPSPGGVRFMDITDGTSNTILAVAADRGVPWTKPEDIPYGPEKALPQFGFVSEPGFHALFADGAVTYLSKATDEATLRTLITRAGGEPIGKRETTDGVTTFPSARASTTSQGLTRPIANESPKSTGIEHLLGNWGLASVNAGKDSDLWSRFFPASMADRVQSSAIGSISFFRPDRLTIEFAPDPALTTLTAVCALSSSGDVKTIEIFAPEVGDKPVPPAATGIYRRRGDELRLRLVKSSPAKPVERPTTFEMTPDAEGVLLVFRRTRTAPLADPAAELQRMQGQWQVVAVKAGEAAELGARNDEFPGLQLSRIDRIDFDAETSPPLHLLDFDTGDSYWLNYGIDPMASPKTMDLLGHSSDFLGRAAGNRLALGIYRFEGERLQVCLARYLPELISEQRPRDFEIEPGSRNVLYTLERYEPSEDEQKLQGAWRVVSWREPPQSPRKFEQPLPKGLTARFNDGHFDIQSYEQEANGLTRPNTRISGLYRLDSTQSPKAIDIPQTSSPEDLFGIYQLDGDRLRIAYRKGGPRPTEFKSDTGSNVTILELEREKPGGPQPVTDPAMKVLEGQWEVVSAAKGTAAQPWPRLSPLEPFDSEWITSFEFSAAPGMAILRLPTDKISSKNPGVFAIQYSIRPDAAPAEIDLYRGSDAQQSPVALGIYQLNDDLLTINLIGQSTDASDRPKDFVLDRSSNEIMFTLRRAANTWNGDSAGPTEAACEDYTEAERLANLLGRDILLVVWAQWSEPDKRLMRETIAPLKRELSRRYVLAVVDYEKLKSRDDAGRLAADIKAVPSYFLISKDGEILAKETGLRDPDKFLEWLSTAAPPEKDRE